MSDQPAGNAFAKYLGYLLSCLIAPIAMVRAFAVTKRHTDLDPRGPVRMLVAIVLGIGLLGGSAYGILGWESDRIDDAGETLVSKLQGALDVAVDDATGEPLDGEATTVWRAVSEQIRAGELEAGKMAALGAIQDLEEAGFEPSEEQIEAGFDAHASALKDLAQILLFFVFPMAFGVLFAPIVFALGRTMSKIFVASKGIGFKPYPATAMSLFLLLGGLGIPAVFLAAASLNDMDGRSVEGQIEL